MFYVFSNVWSKCCLSSLLFCSNVPLRRMFLILTHRLLQPVRAPHTMLHGWWRWWPRMVCIGILRTRYCIYVCVWLLCSSVFNGFLSYCVCVLCCWSSEYCAPHPWMNTQVTCLAATAQMAGSYLKVCPNGLLPTSKLVDAMKFLKKAGLLNISLFCKLELLWSYVLMYFLMCV